MFGFHERRRIKRYLYSRAVLLVLFLVVCGLGFSVWNIYGKARETGKKKTELTAKHEELERRAERLASEIELLDTERGIEAEVRERFDVGRPGEQVILVVEPKEQPEVAPEPKRKGFWEWMKGLFE